MLLPLLKHVVCFPITDNIVSTVKFFVHDTSLFCAVSDTSYLVDKLNNDPQKISK